MEFYGISSKGNKLIQSYLNREFCYKNNSMKYFLNVSQVNTTFHKAWYLDHYFFPFTLMIFQKWYLIYPNQLYLQMIQA